MTLYQLTEYLRKNQLVGDVSDFGHSYQVTLGDIDSYLMFERIDGVLYYVMWDGNSHSSGEVKQIDRVIEWWKLTQL